MLNFPSTDKKLKVKVLALFAVIGLLLVGITEQRAEEGAYNIEEEALRPTAVAQPVVSATVSIGREEAIRDALSREAARGPTADGPLAFLGDIFRIEEE